MSLMYRLSKPPKSSTPSWIFPEGFDNCITVLLSFTTVLGSHLVFVGVTKMQNKDVRDGRLEYVMSKTGGQRPLPRAGDQRCHLLQLEGEVWRPLRERA